MHAALQSIQADPHSISTEVGGNRQQWAQLVSLGNVKTRDGRGPFMVDKPSEIIASSFAHTNTGKLPVDYDHAIDLAAPQGRPAPAAGWITEMETRSDGIWGLIEWTPNAAKAVGDKEYRFLSPVLMHTADMRVMSIARASLTNNPNLTLKSLNAAQKGSTMDIEELLGELRTALGLAADTLAPAVVAAVKKLTESLNSIDPALFVPMAVFQQTLSEVNKLRSGISLQQAEAVVKMDVEAGAILPFMKDWAVSLCQSNKAAYDDLINGVGKPMTSVFMSLNHGGIDAARQRQLEGGGGVELSEVHANIGVTAEDIQKYGGKA